MPPDAPAEPGPPGPRPPGPPSGPAAVPAPDPAAVPAPDPASVARYARAAAVAAGLAVDDAWWPAVVRHLEVLLVRAASLETGGFDLPDDPAPVFRP